MPCNVMEWVIQRNEVLEDYVMVMMSLYDVAKARARFVLELLDEFGVKM